MALVGLLIAGSPNPSFGATITVTSTNDSGAGSLRQAILSANATANVPDVINFGIVGVSGTGPYTISPVTPLPVVADPVIIDGYSQFGASTNTLANGDNAVLKILVLESLALDTTNSTVRGLAIRQIQIGSPLPGPKGNNVIEGCFIGLDTTGTNSLASPGFGVFVQTPNNRIGGTSPAARNLISGKGATGIEIFETFGTNNVVQGNFIGTDRTGTQAIGNTDRALVVNQNASGNTIGGIVPGARNLISGNLDRGITLDGANNLVQGNRIGTDVTGLQPLGNARTGVEIGGPGNTVGGTNSAAANIIAFNGVNGNGSTTNGVDVKIGATGYAILGNSIFENLGLGIDVNANGIVTPGFPVLTVVSNTGAITVIKGTHTPNVSFRLELFTNPNADPSGNGEGKTLLTSTNVTPDGGGNFTVNWPAPIAPGIFITATANGATEFSQARIVAAPGGPNSWINGVSGKWEVGANWSLNVAPFIGQSLISITNAGSKTVNNDVTTATAFPSTLTISNLVISAPGGGTNTLLLAHGGTSTPLRILRSFTLNSGGALVINNAALRLEGPPANPPIIDGALTLNGGSLTVTNNSVQLLIGNNGSGTLTVSNGTLMAYYPIVGANAGANGTWNIAGGTNIVTTTFDIADDLTATGTVRMTGGLLSVPGAYIGLFGNGNLIVSNGTFQCAGQGLVASQPGARGNFTAAGGTSTFGNLLIGESSGATGAVHVTGTALVQVNGPLDNRGSITVSGGRLNVLGEFRSDTPGQAVLVTGGQFAATNDNSFLTRVSVSNGTFLARDVFLGNQKVGIFTVAGNGAVALPGSFNGFSVGVNGGTGTVWQAGGLINLTNTDLNVGGLFSPATGQMTISNGVTQARRLFVGGQGDGTGTFTMAGGTLIATNLQVNSLSRFFFNKGLVRTRAAAVATALPFVVGDGINTAELNLLGGTNVFTAGLRIAANSLLTGVGTIGGDLVVSNGARFSPGSSIGKIVLSNSPSLQGAVVMEITKNGTTLTNDQLQVIASLTYGGSLIVSNLGATALANGDNFKLFSAASYAGTFSSLTLPPLEPGLNWTNKLLVDGSIAVVGVSVSKFASITLAGTNLILIGTNGTPGANYAVVTATNVALPLSNWMSILTNQFGAGGGFSFTNGISPAEPRRFFRIRTP
jgi:hypothetical protein